MVAYFGIPMVPLAVLAVLDATTTVPQWLQYTQSAGVLGVFIVLFYGMLTRKIVPGWTYDAVVEERDYYRSLAFRTTDIADRQVGAAEAMLERLNNLTLRSEVLEAREERRREQR